MAQRLRPALRFSKVTEDALREWDDSGSKFWPCPEGGFAGKKVEVFWDMENCPLNASWPPGNGLLKLNAHQHYDLLHNVFCRASGVKFKDFRINVFIANDTLRTLGKKAETEILEYHSGYVSHPACAGKSAGKPELHEVDTMLKKEINRYLHDTRPGDILVLISGDKGYMPIIREAFQMYDVQVLQVYPDGANGTGRTAAVWLNGAGRDYVGWAAPWGEFLSKHARSKYRMRPSEVEEAAMIKERIHASLKFERELGEVGIVLLVDATRSMEDAIKAVKEKIETELLRELQERYPAMKDKFRFAILGYRDVKTRSNATKEGRQFATLDFCSDLSIVSRFLRKLPAGGGEDQAEDIAGALMRACELKGWPKQSVLFHVFDEPGHGKRFNDLGPQGDDYYEAPPPGRRDPSEEIAEALHKLRESCKVVKYYALTIDRWTGQQEKKPSGDSSDTKAEEADKPSTHMTVAALKEIVAELPPMQSQFLDDGDTRESWFEEVPMGNNAASLVRSMIGATSRTLGSASSRSMTLSLRNRNTAAAAVTMKDEPCEPLLLPDSKGPGQDIGSLVFMPRVSSTPVLPAIAAAQAAAAKESPKKSAWGSVLYKKWLQGAGPFFDNLKARFFSEESSKVFKVQISELHPPEDFEDLLKRIDNRAGLDAVENFQERKYRVLTQPFAKGGERSAYLAKDVSLPAGSSEKEEPLHVLKEFRIEGAGWRGMLSVDRLRLLVTAQAVAGFLAQEYNKDVQQVLPGALKLEYLKASTAKYIAGRGKGGIRNMFQEEFIVGRFRKFNSNFGYVAPPEDYLPVCDAFPHWTYYKMGGRLMVTDVQGWLDQENNVVRLTDPCVHSQTLGLLDDVNKDNWLTGMEAYFKSHTCGETCKALGLDTTYEKNSELAKIRERIKQAAARYIALNTAAEQEPPGGQEKGGGGGSDAGGRGADKGGGCGCEDDEQASIPDVSSMDYMEVLEKLLGKSEADTLGIGNATVGGAGGAAGGAAAGAGPSSSRQSGGTSCNGSGGASSYGGSGSGAASSSSGGGAGYGGIPAEYIMPKAPLNGTGKNGANKGGKKTWSKGGKQGSAIKSGASGSGSLNTCDSGFGGSSLSSGTAFGGSNASGDSGAASSGGATAAGSGGTGGGCAIAVEEGVIGSGAAGGGGGAAAGDDGGAATGASKGAGMRFCKPFAKGHCKAGDSCEYKHVLIQSPHAKKGQWKGKHKD